MANRQTKGKGQMGARWEAVAGENLTASVFKRFKAFDIELQFYVSMVVSLSIIKVLHKLEIPRLKIKWPNDILSADKKIAGILIENVIKENQIKGSVLGIGLNVNQTEFNNLPRASSLKKITHVHYDIETILINVVENLKVYFELLENHQFSQLQLEYEALLFRKNKPSTFKTSESTFTGLVKGVTKHGKLKVLVEDDVIKTYELKEVELLY